MPYILNSTNWRFVFVIQQLWQAYWDLRYPPNHLWALGEVRASDRTPSSSLAPPGDLLLPPVSSAEIITICVSRPMTVNLPPPMKRPEQHPRSIRAGEAVLLVHRSRTFQRIDAHGAPDSFLLHGVSLPTRWNTSSVGLWLTISFDKTAGCRRSLTVHWLSSWQVRSVPFRCTKMCP
jgi:hypothetical protein